ncbi:TPA: hypothetical protein N0F65_011267 [Lagenidium giganteum]|uniref:Transposase n=1 Tax=Lagenidium giganteum TaxID=4803 RepID=A0AAV2Z0V9_9STRA|nr:TPA: hypothetical protein N0F65_011267 [Lagenidium giganteum]
MGIVASRHRIIPMRIYMKDMPTKWGTKFLMVCCADTTYCSRSDLDDSYRKGWNKSIHFSFKKRRRDVPRGAYRIARTTNVPELVAGSWTDSRAVNFLATGCSTKRVIVKRSAKDGSVADVPCPEVVRTYHNGMGGVDQHDAIRLHRYSVQKALRHISYYKNSFLGGEWRCATKYAAWILDLFTNWHDTWKNATIIHPELPSKIRFRKRKIAE